MLFIVAMTINLVEKGANRLRYLVSSLLADVTASINLTTTNAGAGFDMLSDAPYGPVRQCANAFNSGLGILAAGAKTTAQARAIWLADNSDTVLGNSKVPRCIVALTFRDPAGVSTKGWTVDADVDASGHPFIIITNNAITGDAYLDVYTQGEIGI